MNVIRSNNVLQSSKPVLKVKNIEKNKLHNPIFPNEKHQKVQPANNK